MRSLREIAKQSLESLMLITKSYRADSVDDNFCLSGHVGERFFLRIIRNDYREFADTFVT